MKKFYDIEIGDAGGAPPKELFEKVDSSTLPSEEGDYITNHGVTPYKDGSFWVNGGRFRSAVEWWLKPYNI
jgi:hypothetical protein